MLLRAPLLLETFAAARQLGGRLRAISADPSGERPHNPRAHAPWDNKGRVDLSPEEHAAHIDVLTRDVGDKHPIRRGTRITSGDHAHAIDSLVRHHQGVIRGATHGHYREYRGRPAKPQQVKDAFGLAIGGVLNTRDTSPKQTTGDMSKDPVRSSGGIHTLARAYKKKVDSGAHDDHPNIFGAYVRRNISNKLRSIRIDKAQRRGSSYETRLTLDRKHTPPQSGRVNQPESGSDTDARRTAIHNRISHHIDRLERADPDDVTHTAAMEGSGRKKLGSHHIAYLRHWHDGLTQGKWDHSRAGLDAAAKSHGVYGKKGFGGERGLSQIMNPLRTLMTADPHMRRLHQETPAAATPSEVERFTSDRLRPNKKKSMAESLGLTFDLFEWACSYVSHRSLFERIQRCW